MNCLFSSVISSPPLHFEQVSKHLFATNFCFTPWIIVNKERNWKNGKFPILSRVCSNCFIH